MKLLVTGARGFVGRHCMPILNDPALEVHATTSKPPTELTGSRNVVWHQMDLLQRDQVQSLIRDVRPTHLLHLAWYTEHGLYWSDPINNHWVEASLELVESFGRFGGQRAVVTGTCAEYAWNNSLCDEDAPARPATVYGSAKNNLRQELFRLVSTSNISLAWARLFFVFGPFEDPRRLIPSVITSLSAGKPALCGSGDIVRDFLYVEDAAGALVKLVGSRFEGIVNVASGTPTSIGELVYAIADQMGSRELVRLGSIEARTGDPLLLVGTNTRLREEVGYEPAFSLNPALAKTIKWWLDNVPG